VQHEGEPLGRRERLEHDEQRQPNRVRQQRLVLGIDPILTVDEQIGKLLFASRLAGAKDVQRDACDDSRQPCAEVVDLVRVRPAEPEPGFLHCVVRFAQRAEHAIRHRSEMRAVLFELLRQPLAFVHRSRSFVESGHSSRPLKTS
jgi:hypothetical protein